MQKKMSTLVIYVNERGQHLDSKSAQQINIPDLSDGYRYLVENAMEIIFTLSPDGTITYINPAYEELSGFTRSELIGKPFFSIMETDDLSLAEDIFLSAPQMKLELTVQEWQIKTKRNQYVVIEFKSLQKRRSGIDSSKGRIFDFGR